MNKMSKTSEGITKNAYCLGYKQAGYCIQHVQRTPLAFHDLHVHGTSAWPEIPFVSRSRVRHALCLFPGSLFEVGGLQGRLCSQRNHDHTIIPKRQIRRDYMYTPIFWHAAESKLRGRKLPLRRNAHCREVKITLSEFFESRHSKTSACYRVAS